MTPSKSTTSACPQCLRKVPARVFERDGRVYLSKECPTHGADEALLASDAGLYWNAGPEGSKGCCALNHSCTMIFEITEQGPEHDKTFHARVVLDGVPLGTGVGRSKKQAEQAAARATWARLDRELGDNPVREEATHG